MTRALFGRLPVLAAVAVLLAACGQNGFTGVWAPAPAACAPGTAGRLVLGSDFVVETLPDYGSRESFAILRQVDSEGAQAMLQVWVDVVEGPDQGIYRWTFAVEDTDRLRRTEVALGSGIVFEPVPADTLVLQRCPGEDGG